MLPPQYVVSSTAPFCIASADAIAAGYPVKTVRLHYPDWSADLAKCCQDLERKLVVIRVGSQLGVEPIGDGRDRAATVVGGADRGFVEVS